MRHRCMYVALTSVKQRGRLHQRLPRPGALAGAGRPSLRPRTPEGYSQCRLCGTGAGVSPLMTINLAQKTNDCRYKSLQAKGKTLNNGWSAP